MARVFIFRASKFPRGSAGANYIQYLADALMSVGNVVIVVGNGENRVEDRNGEAFVYEGIEYFNNNGQNRLEETLCFSRNFLKCVKKKYSISENDYAISYSPDYFTLRYLTKMFSTEHISVCRVEHFQPHQYKGGKLNPKYWVFAGGVRYLHKVVKRSIPISSYIQRMDADAGCKTLLLPIMADMSRVTNTTKPQLSEELNFIYAGVKQTGFEDDIQLSLESFDELPNSELEKLNIHITGISKERFCERYCRERSFEKVLARCHFYGWLEYEELEALYQRMHYLILARKCNQITKANFPSKVPELMAYGVVPICTDVGDYTKYYLNNEQNSFIAAQNSIDSFFSCIRKACNIDESAFCEMSNQAIRTVKDRFDYTVWSKAIAAFVFNK